MLKKANELYCLKEYQKAKIVYEKAYHKYGFETLKFNINLCNIKLNDTSSKLLVDKVKIKQNINYLKKSSDIFKQNLECFDGTGIKGWIFPLNNTESNEDITVKLVIDDSHTVSMHSFIDRPDITKVFGIKYNTGYKITIPNTYLDGKIHNFKIVVTYNSKEYLIKEKEFSEKSQWMSSENSAEKVVLFCTHNLRSQGAQNSLFELAIGLRRLYNITPVIYSPSGGPLGEKYASHGIKVIVDNSFNIRCNNEILWNEEINLLASKLKQLKCSVVVANTLLSFYMVQGAEYAGIPSIFIPRESEPPKTYFDYLPVVAKEKAFESMYKASQVVFVADATRRPWSFLKNYESFKVIHNSLNTSLLNQNSNLSREEIRQSFNINKDDVVLLSLGTVTPRKGQMDFVQSLPKIFKKSTKPIKAVIVGIDTDKGNDTEAYSKEIYKLLESFPLNIRKNIILIPETDKQKFTKPYEFYAMADIYVFTSRIESFPRVMLEALYFGLPVVSTPCFGVVEQCVENYNAYYYNEEDISTLSNYTLQLVNDEKQRKLFSKASKQLFRQLQTYDQMIHNYYRIIENITKGN